MHHADGIGQRVTGRAQPHLAALDLHRAIEFVMNAGDDLHQRRLAGPILADQPVNFAGLEREADIFQRQHATEMLRDT